jgi:hypothetical protein
LGQPPDEVLDQVDFPEQITHDEGQSITNLASIYLDSQDRRPDINTMDNTSIPHNLPMMTTPVNDHTLTEYYKYLTLLNNAALTSGAHPGAVPNGYESWAATWGYAHDIYDARGRIAMAPRFSGAYNNANGTLQWAMPDPTMHGHGHYVHQAHAPSGLMTMEEHLPDGEI